MINPKIKIIDTDVHKNQIDLGYISLDCESLINLIVDHCEIKNLIDLIKKRLVFNAYEKQFIPEYSKINKQSNEKELKDFLNLLK